MTVIQFPPHPSKQSVSEIAARASATYRRWEVQCLASDDGLPFLSLEHRSDGTVLGAHWKAGLWVVSDERWAIKSQSHDLWVALAEVLAH